MPSEEKEDERGIKKKPRSRLETVPGQASCVNVLLHISQTEILHKFRYVSILHNSFDGDIESELASI